MLQAVFQRPNIKLGAAVIAGIVSKPFKAFGIEVIFGWFLESAGKYYVAITSSLFNFL